MIRKFKRNDVNFFIRLELLLDSVKAMHKCQPAGPDDSGPITSLLVVPGYMDLGVSHRSAS
jgi:hypothetical protein